MSKKLQLLNAISLAIVMVLTSALLPASPRVLFAEEEVSALQPAEFSRSNDSLSLTAPLMEPLLITRTADLEPIELGYTLETTGTYPGVLSSKVLESTTDKMSVQATTYANAHEELYLSQTVFDRSLPVLTITPTLLVTPKLSLLPALTASVTQTSLFASPSTNTSAPTPEPSHSPKPVSPSQAAQSSGAPDVFSVCDLETMSDPDALFHVAVTFDAPLPVEQVIDLVNVEYLTVTMLVYQQEDHTGWYRIRKGQTLAEAVAEFEIDAIDAFVTLLKRQILALSNDLAARNVAMCSARRNLLLKLQRQLSSLNQKGLYLRGVWVFGKKYQIEKFLSDDRIVLAENCLTLDREPTNDNSINVPAFSTWTPQYGWLEAVDGDYIYSDFLWTDASGFNSDYPYYEHDIYHSRADFVECEATFSWYVPPYGHSNECSPSVMFSNLPSAYPDTRYSDDVETYTIGSGAAQSIQTMNLYYTLFETVVENTNQSLSGFGITSDLGRWYHSWNPAELDFYVWASPYIGSYAAGVWAAEHKKIFPRSGEEYTEKLYRYSSLSSQWPAPNWGTPDLSTYYGTDILFEWQDYDLGESYRIQVATDSSFSNVIIDASNLAESWAYITGFPDNGTDYWWRVGGYYLGDGLLQWSDIWHFTNGPSAMPAMPTLNSPANGANAAGTQVTFQWNSTPRSMTYQFQLSMESDFGAEDIVVDTYVSYPYIGTIINGLPDNGWDFWWRVKAGNSLGWSGWSSAWHFYNGPSAIPATPALNSPANGATVAGTQVTFQWYSTSRAMTYQFQLSMESDFSAEDIVVDTYISYPYIGTIINGLPDNGWDFWWRVKASNSLGESGWSSAWHLVNGPSATPATPTLNSPANGANVAGTQVTFQWYSTSRAMTYQFQLSLESDFGAEDIVIDTEVSYPYIGTIISGLPDNGWDFWWRVKASNSLGESGWSSAWHFYNGPSAIPATPTLSSPANGATVAGTQVTFQWNSTPRAMAYQFQLSLESDFDTENIVVDTQVSYPYIGVIISGLPDNGWDFWWRVKAGNSLGESGWSSAWHFVNGPSAVPAMPELSNPSDGSNIAGMTILFRWNSAPRAINYQLQVAVESGFDPEDLVLDTEVPYPYIGVYISGFPDVGVQYWWRVRAENALGWSGWSNTWSFTNGPSVPAQISGTVTDGTTPLALVTVSTGYKATLTDEMGHYTLDNLHPSAYTVTAGKSGYQTAQQAVQVSEGQVVTGVDFVLTSDGTTSDIETTPLSLTFVVTESQALGTLPQAFTPTRAGSGSSYTPGGEVPGEYVVRMNPRTTQREISGLTALVNALGGQVIKSRVEPDALNLQGHAPYLVIEVPQGTPSSKTELLNMEQVLSITPRQYSYALGEPDDPLYPGQWALPRIQAPLAWESGDGLATAILAIVDTGIDYNHPDLAARFGALKGHDIVDNDADPAPDTVYEYHGTHVAGIAAATTQDGIGVAGIAPATLLSVRALDEAGRGYQDDIADGINWAVSQGADIINMSLGGATDPVLQTAVENAWNNDVLLIAAAGNDGQSGISYPAAYDEVIAVGALTPTDERADFSNYGPGLEVSAPGVSILSTLPGDDYGLLNGTSMASPVVAGVAALVASHGPSLSNAEIRAILQTTSDDLGAPGWDETFGYGRVNAYAAVRAVLGEQDVQGVQIANVGDATLEIAGINRSGDWLIASPSAFRVVSGAFQAANVVVDATGLAPGLYVDHLIITSSDPDEPTVSVTITLQVGAALARFGGTVQLDGGNVPEGTTISAWIGPALYATTTTSMAEGVSQYNLTVPRDDPATPEKEGGVTGDIIVFKITDHTAEQAAVWQASASAIPFDLSALSSYSDTQSIPGGNPPPITFEDTNLTIDFAASCNEVVTVTMYNQDLTTPPPGNPIMSKYWDVSASCEEITATLVFTYYESDLLGATESDIVGAARYDEQDGWVYITGTVDTTLNTVSIPDVTEFSRWTLLNAAPPKATTDLSASKVGSDLVLDWSAVTQDISGQSISIATYNIYRAANNPYFVPGGSPYATTSNDTFTDGGAVGDPNTNYYYVVTAVDTAGRESAISNRVGEFDFELRKTTGTDYTWIALPLQNSSLTMTSDLEQYIEANCSTLVSVSSIARWNAPGQQLVQYTTIPIPIGDFGLQTGQAYRVESDISGADSCIWTLTGTVPRRQVVSFDLVTTTGTDYTWISLPLDHGHLGLASELRQAIEASSGTQVLSICRWNAVGQQFVCYTTVPIPIGDFAIGMGYPYRIEISNPVSWP